MVSSLQCLFCFLNFCFQVSCGPFSRRPARLWGFHKKCFPSSRLQPPHSLVCSFHYCSDCPAPTLQVCPSHCHCWSEAQARPHQADFHFHLMQKASMLLYFPRRHQDDIHLVVLSADYMQEFRCHPLEHLLWNRLSFIKVLQCLQWQKEKSSSFLNSGFSVIFDFPLLLDCFTVNMEETEMTKAHSYYIYFSHNPTPPHLNTMLEYNGSKSWVHVYYLWSLSNFYCRPMKSKFLRTKPKYWCIFWSSQDILMVQHAGTTSLMKEIIG